MTPEIIRNLTDADRVALLEKLAVKRYGARWQDPLAREMGMVRSTVFKWRQRGEVPLPVLYALAAWDDDGVAGREDMRQLAQLMAEQIKVAQRLARAFSRPEAPANT